tara:strand:- start:386 stop:613 length:228 start_codon:yes stop_codon:yes gene_type:complete
MKIGDMVQWIPHSEWTNAGLGVIIDSRANEFRVAWLDDIEDHGWDGVFRMNQWWYGPSDLEENIVLAVEAADEDR